MENQDRLHIESVEKDLQPESKAGLSSRFNRMKLPQKILLIAVLLMIALGVYRIASIISGPPQKEEPPVNVTVSEAETGSIFTTSPVTGRIAPVNEAVIVPLASGKVTAVYVSLGDYVEKGTILFEIDKTQIAASYSQATAAFQAAKTAYNAMSTLYAEGAVSLADYEAAKSAYASAQAAATMAGEAYRNCSPSSPISGYITSLNVSLGNLATTGSVAATIADTSSLKIDADITEYLLGTIAVGDEVQIYVGTLGDTAYAGQITALSPAPAAGGLTYPITVTVTDKRSDIKAGMFAEVQIIAESKDQVIIVPSDAVVIKSGRSLVATIDENNIPTYKEVVTGIDNGKFVEVKAGLTSGEKIITSGQQYITEGQAVNVIE